MVQDRGGLSPSLPHVALHGVELRHGAAVRLSWGPFDHVAAVLWSPQCGVAAQTGKVFIGQQGRKQKKKQNPALISVSR